MEKTFITQNVRYICNDGLNALNQWEGDALSYLKADPRKNHAAAWCVIYGNKTIRANKDVISIAVAQVGRVLKFASKELRDDKEVVCLAIAQNSRVLQFASDRLKNDLSK